MDSYEANKARGPEQEPGVDLTVHQRVQQHPGPCFCGGAAVVWLRAVPGTVGHPASPIPAL